MPRLLRFCKYCKSFNDKNSSEEGEEEEKKKKERGSKKWHLNKFSLVKTSITSGHFCGTDSASKKAARDRLEKNKGCENTTSTRSWATVFFSPRFILVPSFRGPPFVSFLLFATWKTERERKKFSTPNYRRKVSASFGSMSMN